MPHVRAHRGGHRRPGRGGGAAAGRRRGAGRRAITVAVMGCRVNGPEEARHADYGIAAGAGEGVLFDHGERVEALPEGQLVDALLARIRAGADA